MIEKVYFSMSYIVKCFMPIDRYLRIDSNGKLNEINDFDDTIDNSYILLKKKGSVDFELIEFNNFNVHFNYIHTNRLIFLHECDIRKLSLLSMNDDDVDLMLNNKLYSFLTESMKIEMYSVQYINDNIGYGLFARSNIPRNHLIGEYTGIVSQHTSDDISNYDYSLDYPCYDNNYCINSKEYGNLTRFINHSNQPNCKFQRIYGNQLYHIIVISIDEINENEEITVNYGESYWNERINKQL